ncbi:MAG TPA: hypothetical protein VNJ09_11400 [Chthonomonadales bacterium]|nr:hypothetical protein [Chthonomonadales bacterium]
MSEVPPAQVPDAEPNPSDTSFTPHDRADWHSLVWGAIGYLAFWQIAPRVRIDGLYVVIVSSLVALAFVIWLTARFARVLHTPWSAVIATLILAVIAIPLRVLLAFRYPPAFHLNLALPGLVDLLFIWFAASIGVLLSLLVKGANMIPPIAAVLALVDIWTVLLGGPVKQVMESQAPAAQKLTQAMTVPLPAPTTGAAPFAVVGFADFLFIAFFIAAICRYVAKPDPYPRAVIALILVLTAYMLVVLITGLSLPALLPMAVVMIALHWRHFHYARSEVFALLYAGLFIAIIAVGFWYFARREETTAKPSRALRLTQIAAFADGVHTHF